MKLSDIQKSNKTKPPRIVLMGSAGIGKTTMGATFPAPIFIQTEDGLGKIDVPNFPLSKSFDDVMGALHALLNEDHDYKSVIVDSIDWLQMLIYKHTCQKAGQQSIESFGYGKGYTEALTYWRDYIDLLNRLRDEKGMVTCQLAHSQQIEVKPPNVEPFHQWQLKLHKHSHALIKEHCDLLGFCDVKTSIVKSETAGGKAYQKAKSDGKRYIYCNKSPERDTKNRYQIETEIEMTWDALVGAIKGETAKVKEKVDA